MLFRQDALDGLRSGAIDLAFRRWRRPSVRAGSTLLTPVGQLDIRSVATVAPDEITDEDAGRAGYPSRAALLADLQRRTEGAVYRIELGALRPDPRIALRAAVATEASEIEALRARLRRLDASAADGAWTERTLAVLKAHPGVRAGDLCTAVGQEKEAFKRNVRKLKNLGLTESLGTGYRLSPRGEALLAALSSDRPPAARGGVIGGPIRWRLHLAAPPERVFAALATDAGRAAFWAETTESDGYVAFRFRSGFVERSRILEHDAPRCLALEYLGGPVRFELTPDGAGGTELRLTHEGVRPEEWIETHAGWLNVLFPLKAWVVHGVDLRNPGPERSWERGYADG